MPEHVARKKDALLFLSVDYWAANLLPSNSPDLSPMEFCRWGLLEAEACAKKVHVQQNRRLGQGAEVHHRHLQKRRRVSCLRWRWSHRLTITPTRPNSKTLITEPCSCFLHWLQIPKHNLAAPPCKHTRSRDQPFRACKISREKSPHHGQNGRRFSWPKLAPSPVGKLTIGISMSLLNLISNFRLHMRDKTAPVSSLVKRTKSAT